VYSGRSLSDTWNLERQLYWNPERSYPTELGSKVRGLAYRKHRNPGRQSSYTGGFLLVIAMEGGQLISKNKLESGKEQGPFK
jgi:hypothetical protein